MATDETINFFKNFTFNHAQAHLHSKLKSFLGKEKQCDCHAEATLLRKTIRAIHFLEGLLADEFQFKSYFCPCLLKTFSLPPLLR